MILVRLAAGTALEWLAGLALLRLLAPELARSGSLAAGLAWLLGAALAVLELTVFSLLDLAWTPWLLALPLLVLIGLSIARTGARGAASEAPAQGAASRALTALVLLLVAFHVALVAWQALSIPPFSDDAIGLWSMRARIFALAGRIELAPYGDGRDYYPLLVPLASSWVYVWGGGTALPDALAKLPQPLFYLAVLLVYHGIGRRLGLDRLAAAVTTLFLAAVPWSLSVQGSLDVADLALAAYLAASASLLLADASRSDPEARAIAVPLLAAAAFTKDEGAPLALLVLVAEATAHLLCRSLRPRLPGLLAGAGAILGVALAWLLVCHELGLRDPGHEHYGLPMLAPGRLAATIGAVAAELLNRARWGWFWPVALAAGAWAAFRVRSRRELFLGLCLGLELAAIVLAFQTTSPINRQPIELYLEQTLERLLVHLAPIAALALLLAPPVTSRRARARASPPR